MGALYDSKSKTLDFRGLRVLFSESAKYQSWLELESALAASQAELGLIPKEAAEAIQRACVPENLNLEEMDQIMRKVGHGFVPFLKTIIKTCGPEVGKYLHYGVTTQNIQQSGQMWTAKKIHRIFIEILDGIIARLASLAGQHRDTVLPGRTHGKHALPITFGFKAAVWVSELQNARIRLKEAEPRVFTIMMGGAVGAFNSVGEIGVKVQELMGRRLDMGIMDIPYRNTNVYKAEYISALALGASTLHRIAEEVYHCSGEEFGELSEAYEEGTVGSSTMPQKVNPKLSKGIIANAQKLYSLLPLCLTNCARPFEADSSSYMVLDSAFQEALELSAEILIRAEELSGTLVIHKETMLKNAGLTRGLINSECLMMKLAEKIGKDEAHTLIQKTAAKCAAEGGDFLSLLLQIPQIKETFGAGQLTRILDPSCYTGLSSEIALAFSEKYKKQ